MSSLRTLYNITMSQIHDIRSIISKFSDTSNILHMIDNLELNYQTSYSYKLSTADKCIIYESDKIISDIESIIYNSNSTSLINEYQHSRHSRKLPSKFTDNILNCTSCGNRLTLIDDAIEIICKCGAITYINTGVCDIQINHYRIRPSTYNDTSHAKIWLEYIQGKDTGIIKSKCIEYLDSIKKRYGISNDKFTYKLIRQYLKKTEYAEYNNSTPRLRYEVTGIKAEEFTNDEYQKIYSVLCEVLRISKELHNNNKRNHKYLPFLICKIIERIMPDTTHRRRILESIHEQSRETRSRSLKLWNDIENRLPHDLM